MAEISFTGHGYTRLISAFANLGPEPSVGIPISLPSSLTRNNVQIVLTPAAWPSRPRVRVSALTEPPETKCSFHRVFLLEAPE